MLTALAIVIFVVVLLVRGALKFVVVAAEATVKTGKVVANSPVGQTVGTKVKDMNDQVAKKVSPLIVDMTAQISPKLQPWAEKVLEASTQAKEHARTRIRDARVAASRAAEQAREQEKVG